MFSRSWLSSEWRFVLEQWGDQWNPRHKIEVLVNMQNILPIVSFTAISWSKCLNTLQCQGYYSMSTCLPFENVKMKIYRTIILLVLLCRYEMWSVRLREEHRVFENRVLRRRRKEEEVTEAEENCIIRSFIKCSLHKIKKEEGDV